MKAKDEPTLAPSTDSPAQTRKKARFGRGAVWVRRRDRSCRFRILRRHRHLRRLSRGRVN